MTRPPAIPDRDRIPAQWLRGIGLLAITALDAPAILAVLSTMEPHGWVRVDGEPPGSRRIRSGPTLAFGLGLPSGFLPRHRRDPRIPPDGDREEPVITSGWIQRLPEALPGLLPGIAMATSGRVGLSTMEREGDGWMVIRVYADDGIDGSRIDVRGELDGTMERDVSAAMLELDAELLRLWDPTTPERSTVRNRPIPLAMRPRLRVRRKPPSRLGRP